MQRASNKKTVFITGGTGYIGKRLIKLLIDRGHRVIALVRKGSEGKVAAGAEIVMADPFDHRSFSQYIPFGSVFIQLLGVPHPSPKKAKMFQQIDLLSIMSSADAASFAGCDHFIYVSVAMTPSKLMHAYQEVRKSGEKYCLAKTFNCSFLRPWYVLGPGHWWPILLFPVYGIAELVPSWRKKVRAMGLVTITQMLATLVSVTENDPSPVSIYEVDAIRKKGFAKRPQLKTLHQKPSYL